MAAKPAGKAAPRRAVEAGPRAKTRLEQLDAQVPTVPTDNSRMLRSYFKTCGDLYEQAQNYLERDELLGAYVYLKRFLTFFLVTVGKHNAYQQKMYEKEKNEYKRIAARCMSQLEEVRDRIVLAENIAEENETRNPTQAPATGAVPESPPAPSAPDASVPAPAPASESESEGEGTSLGKRDWSNLKPPAAYYGVDESKVRDEARRRSTPSQPDAYPHTEKDISARPTPTTRASPSHRLNFLALRRVVAPLDLPPIFMQLARANTERGVETCGILCGKLRGGEFELSHLIIPVQEGSPNTTVTRGEELLIDAQEKHGLMTLGWIHTHPTQDCFLSSVDLHTQFSYQTMMPEAVAIVMAPRARVQQGVFTITPRGMEVLDNCDRQGFHSHDGEQDLFGVAQHLQFSDKRKVQVIDLRSLASQVAQ